MVNRHTWYLSFFLHRGNFFHTKERKRNKTDSATKVRKLQQNPINHDKINFTTKQHKLYIWGDIFHMTHMPGKASQGPVKMMMVVTFVAEDNCTECWLTVKEGALYQFAIATVLHLSFTHMPLCSNLINTANRKKCHAHQLFSSMQQKFTFVYAPSTKFWNATQPKATVSP